MENKKHTERNQTLGLRTLQSILLVGGRPITVDAVTKGQYKLKFLQKGNTSCLHCIVCKESEYNRKQSSQCKAAVTIAKNILQRFCKRFISHATAATNKLVQTSQVTDSNRRNFIIFYTYTLLRRIKLGITAQSETKSTGI